MKKNYAKALFEIWMEEVVDNNCHNDKFTGDFSCPAANEGLCKNGCQTDDFEKPCYFLREVIGKEWFDEFFEKFKEEERNG